jgi:hypothetical protein
MPLSKKLDMLSSLADTVEIISEARERRLAKEVTLKVAEQPDLISQGSRFPLNAPKIGKQPGLMGGPFLLDLVNLTI